MATDDKLIQWVKDDLDSLKEFINEKFEKQDEKIEMLLKFKWQIVGGSVVISLLVTVLFQIILSTFKG